MNTLVLIGLALLFFALIMASIALHEIGHLVPAKSRIQKHVLLYLNILL